MEARRNKVKERRVRIGGGVVGGRGRKEKKKREEIGSEERKNWNLKER